MAEARTLTCQGCGVQFTTRNPRQHSFCTLECYRLFGAGDKIAAWYRTDEGIAWQKNNAQRMRAENPMFDADVREQLSETMKARGYKPVQGGNGKGPTKPEAILLEWFPIAVWNYAVATNIPRGIGFPTNYKIDVAFVSVKLAVEVDGKTHDSRSAQAIDAKKTAVLERLGWRVLRFKNQYVLDAIETVVAVIDNELRA